MPYASASRYAYFASFSRFRHDYDAISMLPAIDAAAATPPPCRLDDTPLDIAMSLIDAVACQRRRPLMMFSFFADDAAAGVYAEIFDIRLPLRR